MKDLRGNLEKLDLKPILSLHQAFQTAGSVDKSDTGSWPANYQKKVQQLHKGGRPARIERPESGTIEQSMVRQSTAMCFDKMYNFSFESLIEVQHSKPLIRLFFEARLARAPANREKDIEKRHPSK